MTHAEQLASLFQGVDQELRVAIGLEALDSYQRKYGEKPELKTWYRNHAGLEDLGDGPESVSEALQEKRDTISRFVTVIENCLEQHHKSLIQANQSRDTALQVIKNNEGIIGDINPSDCSPLVRYAGKLDLDTLPGEIAADTQVWTGVLNWWQAYLNKLNESVRTVFAHPEQRDAPEYDLGTLVSAFTTRATTLGGIVVDSSATGRPLLIHRGVLCQSVEGSVPLEMINSTTPLLHTTALLAATLHKNIVELTQYIRDQVAGSSWDRCLTPYLRRVLEIIGNISSCVMIINGYHNACVFTLKGLVNTTTQETASMEDINLDYSNWGNLY